ncbi:hypothetical protein T01_6906, partial [Trichinella spiralis]
LLHFWLVGGGGAFKYCAYKIARESKQDDVATISVNCLRVGLVETTSVVIVASYRSLWVVCE